MSDVPFAVPRYPDDIRDYISEEISEGRHLEFKSGRLVNEKKTDQIGIAISKQISGFANAGGGVVVIGVRENRTSGQPSTASSLELVTDPKHNREWLEQVLGGLINPALPNIEFLDVPFEKGHCLVVSVPQSNSGPHQASDDKYYARRNFRTESMAHYEIEDVRSRVYRAPYDVRCDIEIRSGVIVDFLLENRGRHAVSNVRIVVPSFAVNVLMRTPTVVEDGLHVLRVGQKMRVGLFEYRKLLEVNEFDNPVVFDLEFQDHTGTKHIQPIEFNASDYIGASVYVGGLEGIQEEIQKGFKALVRVMESRR